MTSDTARVGGLLEKHHAGVREASSELTALVVAEIRRAAPAQHRDAPADVSAEEQLSNLIARVLSESALDPKDRAPFLTIYARAVRQVVCARLAEPGAAAALVPRDDSQAPTPEMVLALDRVLHSLEQVNGRLVATVECLYFARLTETETAAALRTDVEAVRREWIRARAWLLKELTVVASSTAREVSVTNAVWVDAVLRTAVGMREEERGEFLEQCHAAAPGLRQDVEALLRLSDSSLPGPSPGDISAENLWAVLASIPIDRADDHSLPLPPAALDPQLPQPASTRLTQPTDFPLEEPVAWPQRLGQWHVVGDWSESPLGRSARVKRDGLATPAVARLLPIEPIESLRAELAHRVAALAALPSPPFAAIHDSGESDDGRIYIVRELIEGRPIDRYCDELQLTVHDRVRMAIRVCAALQTAHRQLVAHGMLTPSQTLIDDLGELRFPDAGIVPLIAALGGRLPATVESDVYQMGVLLGELLVGERIRPAAASQADMAAVDVRPSDIARTLSSVALAARSTTAAQLSKCLRGDMDAIVRTALHDNDGRYPSIGALAADLQRWLDHRPVWARPPTRRYLTAKFVERHRGLLVAFIGVAMVGGAWIWSTSDRSPETTRNPRSAELGQVLAGLVGTAERDPSSPSRGYLDRATNLVRTELANEPRDRAALLLAIGQSYTALGQYQAAVDVIEESLLERRRLSGDDSSDVADALEAQGTARHRLGRLDQAETDFRTASTIRTNRFGATSSSVLAANVSIGTVLHARGRLAEAETLLRDVAAALETTTARADHPDLVPRMEAALATVLRDRGLLGESETLFRRALAAPVAAATLAQRPVWLAAFADVLVTGGAYAEADTMLAEARASFRRAQSADHLLLLDTVVTEARLRLETGRLDAARDLLQEAMRMQQELIRSNHPIVPAVRTRQAELARREGRLDEAIDSARLALDAFERLGLVDHPATMDARWSLAEALMGRGRRAEAAPVLRRAIAAAERTVVADDPRLRRLRASLVASGG